MGMRMLKKISNSFECFLIALIPVSLIFWKVGSNKLYALWMERWLVLYILIAAFFFFRKINKGNPIQLVLLDTYIMISGIVSAFCFGIHKDEPFEMQTALRNAALMTFVSFILLRVYLTSLSGRVLAMLRQFVWFLGVVTSATVIVSNIILDRPISWRVLLFDNPSMTACFVVPCLFLETGKNLKKWIVYAGWAIGLAMVCLTKATAPMVGLVGGLVGYSIYKKKYIHLLGAASVFVAVAVIFPEAISTNGRFAIWYNYVKWVNAFDFYTASFGTGMGSSRIWIPMSQVFSGRVGVEGPWFFWLHNDWLQLACELGILGFLLVINFLIFFLNKARQDKNIFMAAMAYAAIMCVNFPIHMPAHAFVGALIVISGLRIEDKENRIT